MKALNPKCTLALIATSATLTAELPAQEQIENTSDIGELGSVVVIGTSDDYKASEASENLAGPYDVITREELKYEHPDDTLELFAKLPGVNIARYNQGIINTDVGIRGFGVDGVTPHAKLLIDGIPSNIHNGYNELDQMFPLAIGSIQAFKGTSDIRYGLYNVAGSYNVFSRTDITNEIQATIDSFGSEEIQAYSGTEFGRFSQNYFLGYRDGEGYRDRTDLKKYTLSGHWKFEIDDTTSVGLSARFSSYEGDSPGYINDPARARRSPRRSELFASQDGGEKEVYQLSAYIDKELLDGALDLSFKAYYNDIYRNRFVRFSQGGDLRNRIDDQQIYGFIATADWELNPSVRLKAGFDFQKQEVVEQRFRTVQDASSPTGFLRQIDFNRAPRRNSEYTFETIGGYVGIEHDVTESFRWNAGVRVDVLDGDFTNIIPDPGVDESIRDFGTIFQPKLNLFYDLNDEVLLFANYGRTFQTPIGGSLFGDNAADISKNDGGEIGVSYSPTSDSTIRLSGWYQVADDEYQIDQFLGGDRSLGKVERQGVELAFSHRFNDAFDIWGNVSYSKSEIEDATDNGGTFSEARGTEVRGTPNLTYSLGGSYQVTDDLTLRLALDGQGDYYINENNVGGRFGDYHTLNLGVDYRVGIGLLTLQVNNITDEYFEYVYDFSQDGSFTIHSPGDGINGSLSYSFEF